MVITTHLLIVLLLSVLGGGLGVNLAAQVIKKLFGLKSDGVIHTMVLAVSFIAGVAQYIIGLKAQLPPEVLGVTSTSIYGISQATFKTTQYVSGFLGEVRAFNESQGQITAAAADDAAIASVSVPDEAVAALTAPQATQPDF